MKGLTLHASLPSFRRLATVSEEEAFKVTDRRHRVESSAESSTAAGTPAGRGADTAGSGARRSDLGGLFMMFASSALVSLGLAPDPQTNESRRDLAQAQAAIDVLLMLREKTDGNRTEQESRLLEGILYDLQMRFVSTVREGPASSE
ncbi:MAG TPA: DUF1844 domain-containing protein [Methylomirabilota bacterium]